MSSSPKVTWWPKGLSPTSPYGAWGAERTESHQSPGYLGPKGLSPTSPQGTWGSKRTESRQSTGYLSAKRTESSQSTGYPWRGLDLDWYYSKWTCTCIYLAILFIKKNKVNVLSIVYDMCWIGYLVCLEYYCIRKKTQVFFNVRTILIGAIFCFTFFSLPPTLQYTHYIYIKNEGNIPCQLLIVAVRKTASGWRPLFEIWYHILSSILFFIFF